MIFLTFYSFILGKTILRSSTHAIISRSLYFFYPFFTAAAAYTAERSLFLDSFFPSGIALLQFDFTSV